LISERISSKESQKTKYYSLFLLYLLAVGILLVSPIKRETNKCFFVYKMQMIKANKQHKTHKVKHEK